MARQNPSNAEAATGLSVQSSVIRQRVRDFCTAELSKLWTEFKNNQGRRGESGRVEEWNVLFLVKHCQYLLLSIDGTDSLSRKIARRVTIGFDAAVSGVSHSFQNLRPAAVELIKRQR